MKLSQKFILSFFLVGIIPVLVLGIILYNIADKNLQQNAFDKLVIVRENKAQYIKDYLDGKSSNINSLSGNSLFLNAYKSFRDGFYSGGVNGELWNAANREFGKGMEKAVQVYDYNDLYFVSNSGDIVYSVRKKEDFKTNALTGPFKDEVINKAFLRGKERISFTDFDFYSAFGGKPAGFVSAPMTTQDGEKIGVIILQLPISKINSIMNESKGMGETGEAYLVGSDKLMRSDSRFSEESTVLKRAVESPAFFAALKGEAGTDIYIDYHGESVVGTYAKLEIGELNWVIIAEVDEDEAFAASSAMLMNTIILLLVGAVISILMGVFLSRKMGGPIHTLIAGIDKLVVGNLRITFDINSKDEIGMLGKKMNDYVKGLRDDFLTLNNNSDTVASSSQELSSISNNLSSRMKNVSMDANDIASASEQLSHNISSMASASEQMSTNASNISTSTDEIAQSSNSVASAVEEMSSSITSIEKNVNEATDVSQEAVELSKTANNTMKKLNASSIDIGKVTELIKRIAEQTNLLALNATIEAASAGEAGKGFAVVANEIKELANQSATAAEDITNKIDGIQKDTTAAVSVIDKVSDIISIVNRAVSDISVSIGQQARAINDIAASVTQTQANIESITETVKEFALGTQDLAKNNSQSAKAVDDMAKNINNVREVINESTESAIQSNTSTEDLAKIAETMKNLISKFQI